MSTLPNQVLATIRTHAMLTAGDHVLVGVSGGADSLALALCLIELSSTLSLTLTLAHLNHAIRGRSADDDEEFVRDFSRSRGLRFVSETIDVKSKAQISRQNLEECARQLRYDFLSRTAARVGATRIAVGHTLNDQAETVLLRMLRGTGARGASAIHPVVGGMIIRPLLECSRELIVDYLGERNIEHREDLTNSDLRYQRNRIRRELLPHLRERYNPRITEVLAREAALAREVSDYLDQEALHIYRSLKREDGDTVILRTRDLALLARAIQRLVLRRAVEESAGTLRGLSMQHVDNILALAFSCQSGRRIELPRGMVVCREFENLVFRRDPRRSSPSFAVDLPIPGVCRIPGTEWEISGSFGQAPTLGRHFNVARLDPSALPNVLVIRSRRLGDRYGGQNHRKVKKMLIDRKIPLAERDNLPMVTDGRDIVWIPGFRPATKYEAAPSCVTCLILEARCPRI